MKDQAPSLYRYRLFYVGKKQPSGWFYSESPIPARPATSAEAGVECEPLYPSPFYVSETDELTFQLELPTERAVHDGRTAMRLTLCADSPASMDSAYTEGRRQIGWDPTPEREAFLAMEYAANHIDADERAEFVTDFAEMNTRQHLAHWVAYADWRSERLEP